MSFCPHTGRWWSRSCWPNIFLLLLYLLLPAVLYGPHVMLDQLWHLDDHALIDPIIAANSWADYRQMKILDIAPLRDLSYWFDKHVWRISGVTIFHLHNALLWGVICFLLSKIFAVRLFSRRQAVLAALLVLVHPMFGLDIYWAAARKHLLAVVFTLLNTYLWCRWHFKDAAPRPAQPSSSLAGIPFHGRCPPLPKNLTITTVVLYLLSLSAWPIVILWPCWALSYRWWILTDYPSPQGHRDLPSRFKNFFLQLGQNLRQDKLLLSLLCLIALAWAVANILYYPHQGAHSKFLGVSWISLAAFGQYFFSFIWPLKIAIGYPLATGESLLGLCLEIFFFYLAFKLLPKRLVFNLFLYYFFSLAIVTVNISHIYVSDTYHTGGGWVLIILLLLIVQQGGARICKNLKDPLGHRLRSYGGIGALVCLLIFFSIYDFCDQKNWSDDYHAYKISYERQPRDGSNLEFYLLNLVHPEREDHFQCQQAWEIFQEWVAVRQGHFSPPSLPKLMSNWYLRKIENGAEPWAVRQACLAALPPTPQVQLTALHLHIRAQAWPPAQRELAALKQIRLLPIFAAQLQRLEKIYLWQTAYRPKRN